MYNKEIKPVFKNNRFQVRLSINNKRKTYSLARVLYCAFYPFDIENKNLCVSFKDGNKNNIHLDNLYLTHRKNLIQGEKHKSRSLLSNHIAEQIKKDYAGIAGKNQFDKKSLSYNDLSKKYGISKYLIYQIIKGNCRNKENYKLK